MTSSKSWPGAWALRAAMAVALLAVMAAGWQLAQARPDGAMAGMEHHGPHHGGGAGLADGRMLQRWLDDANATAEQRSRIRDIFQAARADLEAGREMHHDLRSRSLALLTQPTLDAAAAEALRQQMLAEHDRRSKRMTQAMLDAAAVLTPEQRGQLGQRLQQRREMMQRHRSERDTLEGRQR